MKERKKERKKIEHQLKSKLAWPLVQRVWSQNKNGTKAMTTAKNEVFI